MTAAPALMTRGLAEAVDDDGLVGAGFAEHAAEADQEQKKDQDGKAHDDGDGELHKTFLLSAGLGLRVSYLE